MANNQKLLIILLIFAIIFSIASVVLTLSLDNLKPVKYSAPSQPQNIAGESAGGIGLIVEPPAGVLP